MYRIIRFYISMTNLCFIRQDVLKLKELYSSVDDIDFIVGAVLETPVEGAKLGPTSRCITADSFYRYKVGDRFFYDVQDQPGSFTAGKF